MILIIALGVVIGLILFNVLRSLAGPAILVFGFMFLYYWVAHGFTLPN